MKVKIAIAQIRTITGDLEGNTGRIVAGIEKAIAEKADIVLFPETAITGYCCGALFDHPHFIDYNLKFLEKNIVPIVPKNLVVIVGFVDKYGTRRDGHPDIYNSVAVIQDGKYETYNKNLLANGSHHEDMKYFTPGEHSKVLTVDIGGQSLKIGVPICEDAWYKDHYRNIVKEMVSNGAELILCPNQSYFYYGKQQVRKTLFSSHAKDNGVPVVTVNAVGVGDIVKNIMIYDGASMVFDKRGLLIEECKQFEEDFKVVEVDTVNEFGQGYVPNFRLKEEEIFEALVFEQRELFGLVGLQKAQVHMSGGIDSSVVLPIVVEAMGKDNVIAISNPTHNNGAVTKGNAQSICDTLGVKLYWNSMEEPANAFVESHTRAFGAPSNTAIGSIQAVGRTVQGLAASHHFKTGIVATGNHTEIVLGWASFHDIGSIGCHSIIGDLTKVEIFKMAEYINRRYNKEIIPKNLYDGTTAPAAELADANEDPFDYWVVSGICAEIIRDRRDVLDLITEYQNHSLKDEYFPTAPDEKTIYERIDEEGFAKTVQMVFERSKISVFKSAQAAPIVIIAPTSRGFSNRETIINKYSGAYEFAENKMINLEIKRLKKVMV